MTTFKSIIDLITAFPTEKSCHQYFAARRWHTGEIICPHEGCGHNKCFVFKDGIRYKCKKCLMQFTAKTNTFMEGSKLPTVKWMAALYLLMHKKGISSVQLAKDVGVTQKTAWFMLHRIRFSFCQQKEEKLTGTVQLDETFVGGKNKNRHYDKKVKNSQGRSFKDKTPVMGLLQQQEYEIVERPHKVIPGKTVKEKVIIKQSEIRCCVLKDTSRDSLTPIVRKEILPGSIIVSDEWQGYNGLTKDYKHEIVDHTRKQYVNANGFTSNAVEGHWSQFKRGIIGIYHKTTPKHLNKYVQEFVFRYNNRNFGIQQQINTIISSAVGRLKYKELILS